MRFISNTWFTILDLFESARSHVRQHLISEICCLLLVVVIATSFVNRSLEKKTEFEAVRGLKDAILKKDAEPVPSSNPQSQPNVEGKMPSKTNVSWTPALAEVGSNQEDGSVFQAFNLNFSSELKKRSSTPLSEEDTKTLAASFSALIQFEEALIERERAIRQREDLATNPPLLRNEYRAFDDVIFKAIASGIVPNDTKELWAFLRKSRRSLLPTVVETHAFDGHKKKVKNAVLDGNATQEHVLLTEYLTRMVFQRTYRTYLSDLGYQEVVDSLPDQSILDDVSPEMHQFFLTRKEIEDRRLRETHERAPNTGLYPDEVYERWREYDLATGAIDRGPELRRFNEQVHWLKTGPDFELLKSLVTTLQRIQSSEFKFPNSTEVDQFDPAKYRPFWMPRG